MILIDLLSGSLMLEEGMDSKDGKDGEESMGMLMARKVAVSP